MEQPTSKGPETRPFSKLQWACGHFKSEMITTHNSQGADLWEDRDFSGYCGCFPTPCLPIPLCVNHVVGEGQGRSDPMGRV